MSTTLADIARRAGCSPATVSRALNGTADVDPQRLARILATVKALEGDGKTDTSRGTSESAAPRRGRPRGSLRKSDAVDIIVFRREPIEPLIMSNHGLTISPITDTVPNTFFSPRFRLTTDFYRHIIEGIVSVLAAHNIKTVQQIRGDILDDAFLHELRTARHRGVLLLGEPDPDVKAFVSRCGCPVILVDILGVQGQPVVAIDNAGGIGQALRHLLDLGHREIGFAGHSSNPSLRERHLAFLGGMAEAGLPVHPEWQYDGPGHIQDVDVNLQRILRRKNHPSAFVCANDYYAMGVMQAAKVLGLRIPQDLSVVGFDDIDAAPLVNPPLTTVRVPKIQLGACAADLLLRSTIGDGLADAWQHCEVRCLTELAIRASTQPLSSSAQKQKKRTP